MVSSLLFREAFGVTVTSELLLAGRKLSAQDAHQLRFVGKVANTAEELRQEGLALAKEMLALPLFNKTLPLYKAMVRPPWRMNQLTAAHELEQEELTRRFQSGETLEAFVIFQEKEAQRKKQASKL